MPQDREQQEEEFEGIRIGASMIADICGFGHNSRKHAWELKTGRRERVVSGPMQHGTDNEFRGITAVECETGIIWDNTGPTFDDQLSLSLQFDGYYLRMLPDGTNADESLEVKCPMTLHDEVPPRNQIQLAVGFMLGPWMRTLFAEWTPAELRMWWVYPNPEFEGVIWPYIKEFAQYIKDDEPPPKFSSKANPKPVLPELRTERIE